LMLLMLFASCKKTDTCTLSSTSILGTYKMTANKYRATGTTVDLDYYAAADACQKDDTYTVASGGVFTITDAGVVCSPSNTSTGTWTLSGTTFTTDGSDAATVASFSCSGMVLTVTDASGTETITLIRQ
jgi:hypothetical protein